MGAFTFDPEWRGTPTSYCAGKLNSTGCVPAISSSGTPSLAGPDDFHILAGEILSQQAGIITETSG